MLKISPGRKKQKDFARWETHYKMDNVAVITSHPSALDRK